MINNVININDIREENKKMLEERAFEQYGVIKANENLYLYPECSYITHTPKLEYLFSEELKMKVEELLEEEVIEAINELVPMKGQKVTIMLTREEENNMLTFDIFNMDTNKNFLLSTPMEYTEENRRIFTGLVAGAIKKIDVNITFFLKMTYNELKAMVES